MPRTKGSKNKPKTVTADYATQIAEKQSAREALSVEIASITANIDSLKVVCEHDNILIIQVALRCAQLELLSDCFHRSIFPQCRPVVKPILGNF